MAVALGSVVHYTLTQNDVNTVMYRRQLPGPDGWQSRLHHGNPLAVGQVLPMIVTFVGQIPTGALNPVINGQVFLDGDDSLWVTNVPSGVGLGTYQ